MHVLASSGRASGLLQCQGGCGMISTMRNFHPFLVPPPKPPAPKTSPAFPCVPTSIVAPRSPTSDKRYYPTLTRCSSKLRSTSDNTVLSDVGGNLSAGILVYVYRCLFLGDIPRPGWFWGRPGSASIPCSQPNPAWCAEVLRVGSRFFPRRVPSPPNVVGDSPATSQTARPIIPTPTSP